jgi:hypothetical protein
MELLNLVKIKQLLGTLERSHISNINETFFNSISFNGFEVEFFAGPKSFCEPAVSYDTLLHYKTLQLYIVETVKESKEAILPGKDNRFQNFDWCKYFTYHDGKVKDKLSYMGCNVPLDEVCRLIKDVYKVSRLKIFF